MEKRFSLLPVKAYLKIIINENDGTFSHLSLNGELPYVFCLYFILYLHVWIHIHYAPEHGSNTDPDPHGFIYTARSFFFKLPVITSQIYRARDPAKKNILEIN